jgi:signal transduction histidine kinase
MSRVRYRRHMLDIVAALGFLVLGTIDVTTTSAREGPLWANLAVVVVVAVAAYLRRRAPLRAAAAFVGVVLLQALLLTPPPETAFAVVGLLVFSYAAGAYDHGLRGALVIPTFVAAIVAVDLLADEPGVVTDAIFLGTFLTASYLVGRAMATRTRLAAELHEAAVQAEEGREAEAALAVAAERRRIAREMHDVVAHSISVMVVQAGGARRILASDPERAVHAAEQIESTGRDALAEMRRLLGVLHPREGAAPEREPQPGMDSLGALVERARSAGLPVEVEVVGVPQPLNAGLDLAAYRIVQEALTNVLKHAASAPTRVTVRWAPDALELAVRDRGPGPAAGAAEDPGHGIVGMRERARLYGGELHAGAGADGGFEVRATLPLAHDRAPEQAVPA